MSLKPYLEWVNCSLVRRTQRVTRKWEATMTFHAEDGEDLGRTGGIGVECVCVGVWLERKEGKGTRFSVPVAEKMLCDLQKWGEGRELRIYMIFFFFFLPLERLSHTFLV